MQADTKKIFIADDDESIVDATILMLQLMGYQVEHTLDASVIMPLLKNKPDLILLDIWISGIDGRDVCRSIKSNPETKNIPILMISASHEIKESALKCGADDFLAKPYEMDDMLDRIEKLLYC